MKVHLPAPITLMALVFVLLLGQCETSEERAEKYYQSGLELLEEGDTARAMVEFRNVFDLDGRHKEARLTYARLLREQGDSAQAYRQYLRLVEQYPDNLEGRRALAHLAVLAQDWEEAERHGTAAYQLAPDDPLVAAVKAMLDYRETIGSDPDPEARAQAVEAARSILEEHPDILVARHVVIDDLLQKGQPEPALEQIDIALEQEPGDPRLQEIRLRLLMLAGEDDRVGAQLRRMTDLFPENERIRNGLISWYIRQDDLEQAEEILRRTAEAADPEQTEPRMAVVQFLRETQGIDAAQAELERLTAENPENSLVYRSIGAVMDFDSGRVPDAIATLEELVSTDTGSDSLNDAKVLLARMYEATGNNVGARAQIEEVLAADASHVAALKMRATWQIEDDQPGEAINTLRQALDQDPRNSDTLTLMARAHQRSGDTQLAGERLALAAEVSGNAPAESLRYAEFLIANDQTGAALGVLNDALRLAPQDIGLLTALAQAYISREDWARADAMIARLREMDNSNATSAANSLKATVLLRQGKSDESIAFIDSLIKQGDADARASALIIQTHVQNGQIEEAQRYLDEQLQENPDAPELVYLQAGLNAVSGKTAEAVELYRQLISENPRDENPVRALYALLSAEGRNDEAGEVLSTALETQPNSVLLNVIQAGRLETSGDYEGAIAIYEKLYGTYKDNLVIANNLASMITTRRPDDEEALQRAAAIVQRLRESDVPAFQDTYGWIAYRLGNFDDALAHLEPAAAGLPNDPLVQFHLGMTYAALERSEEAREALELAIQLGGDAELSQLETARETLDALPAPESETPTNPEN